MGLRKKDVPAAEADEEAIQQLHAARLGRNEIARHGARRSHRLGHRHTIRAAVERGEWVCAREAVQELCGGLPSSPLRAAARRTETRRYPRPLL
ncbi:hypothetical protein GCM10010230_24500 [Streptomyces narbonensis]|nr:hypothetical protein GCM10010230_24500 [Streptomyces narbonensis]